METIDNESSEKHGTLIIYLKLLGTVNKY